MCAKPESIDHEDLSWHIVSFPATNAWTFTRVTS